MRARAALLLACAACTKPGPAPTASPALASNPSAAPSTAPPLTSPSAQSVPSAPPDPIAARDAGARRSPVLGDDAEAILFADAPRATAAREAVCPSSAAPIARVLCLIDLRYGNDRAAQKIARELYARHGILAGVEADHVTEMSWRGKIHIVPEPPIGKYRTHLEWMASAARDFDDLFAALDPDKKQTFRYQWRPFVLRYMRSVDRTTPSAYAAFDRWEIAYNVLGSLNTSEEAVRELFFHELFHRNDADDDHWSQRVLAPIYLDIKTKCGPQVACLTPYTPTTTMVRGGTYYAFQPEDYDPVHEYAAELAIRWYREHRAIVKKQPRLPAFKCGPRENARTWELIVSEFFAGVDLVPPCSK